MTSTTDPPPLESPRVVIVRRLVITLIVLACIAGMALAVAHTRRGDDVTTVTGSPNVVELLAPTDGSTVLSQAQIEIDLTTRYDANLVLNGVLIPDDQLQRRPELNQVTFTPGPGKIYEQLPAGRNCVRATIFRVDGVAEQIPPVSWCFEVT